MKPTLHTSLGSKQQFASAKPNKVPNQHPTDDNDNIDNNNDNDGKDDHHTHAADDNVNDYNAYSHPQPPL